MHCLSRLDCEIPSISLQVFILYFNVILYWKGMNSTPRYFPCLAKFILPHHCNRFDINPLKILLQKKNERKRDKKIKKKKRKKKRHIVCCGMVVDN